MERNDRRSRLGLLAMAACLALSSSACELRGSSPSREASEAEAASGVAVEELALQAEGFTTGESETSAGAILADDTASPDLAARRAAPVPSPDFDGDGFVGASDFFGGLRPCFGADLVAKPECAEADLDGDGFVGASDFFSGLRPRLGEALDPGPTAESERISAELLVQLTTNRERPDVFGQPELRAELVAELNAPIHKKLTSADLRDVFETDDLVELDAFVADTTLFDQRDRLSGIEAGLEGLRADGVGQLAYFGLQRESGIRTYTPGALQVLEGGSGSTRTGGSDELVALGTGSGSDELVAPGTGSGRDELVALGTGGGTQSANFPGVDDIFNDGGEYLVRHAAWHGLPVHADPYFQGGVVDTLFRNQMVWVVDASPFTQLQSELEDSLNDSLWFALGQYGAMYYLKVFVPESGATGYVPLYSLVAQPLEFDEDRVRVEVGYGLMAREMNSAITATFEPDSCEDEQVFDLELAGQNLWAVTAEGPFKSCSEEDQCAFCEEVLTHPEDYLSQKEQCWANPEAFFGDCKNLDTYSPIPYCEDHLIWSGSIYSVPNTDDYRCGEYPIGETNWWDPDWETYDHNEMVNNRLLHEFEITGWEHHVKMKRGQHQDGFNLSKYNLSQSEVVDIAYDGAIDSKNFWMAVEPSGGAYQWWESGNNRSVRLHACAHLPGGTVFSPHKDYGAYDGVPNGIDDFFYWINWGRVDWDRADICAVANVTLNGFTPAIEWEEVTKLQMPGFDISNVGWSLRAWVVLGAGLVLVFTFGLFGPIIGGIVTAAIGSALGLAVAGTSLVNLTNNDEWVISDVVEFVGKGKVYDMALDELNDMTQTQLSAALANVPSSAAAACASAFPGGMPPMGSPASLIYNQCIALVNSVDVIPFVTHAGNEQDGCYDLDHFWTPAGKTDPDSGPWWYRFDGQGWLDGTESQDTGCRIGFAGRTTLEQDLWPTLQCLVAETNLAFNNELSTGTLVSNISANCSAPAHQALAHYFGPASDVYELLEAKHPDDGIPDDFQPN